MVAYVVTGKLGAGKTLVAVGKIKDKLSRGCKVATNLDIHLHKLVGEKARNVRLYRIPDKPTLPDLESIGKGNDSYDEDKNGLLVLDECGTWFNSRSWADKSRQSVINWFLHARKLGWDIMFLIQDVSIMDKQARLALAELVVYCRRLDRVTLPIVGSIYSMFVGSKLPLPKLHVGIVKYGDAQSALVVERWTYRGRDLYSSYDTKQAFSDHYEHGTYSLLPPWYTHGMFRVPRDGDYYVRMTKIYWKRFNRPFLALCSFALGIAASASVLMASTQEPDSALVEVVEETPLDMSRFDGARIVGYSRLGNVQSYRVLDADGVEVTSADLRKLGYRQSFAGACSLTVSNNGGENVSLSC